MLKKVVFMFVAMAIACPVMAADENPWKIVLPFEKATIEYELTGIEQGIERLYIRDRGRRQAKYRTATMLFMGIKKPSETIEFTDPEWIYTFDLIERTGVKAVNPRKYLIEEYDRLNREEKEQVRHNSEQMSMGPMFGGMSAEVEKDAGEILGFQCERVSFMGSTVYSIQGTALPLKIETKMMGMENLTRAVALKEGSAPEKYFKHPEGIAPVLDPEAEEMARIFAHETIVMLKDPDALEKARKKPVPGMQQQLEMTPEERQEMEQAMEALKNIFGN